MGLVMYTYSLFTISFFHHPFELFIEGRMNSVQFPFDALLLLLLLVSVLLLASTTDGQYLVEILERAQLGGHRPVVRCEATGATFGGDVISFSFGLSAIGCALPTEPADGCGNITAFFAQNAEPNGYSALILFSAKGQSPIPMSGSKYAENVTIPVVMVNYGCMQSLLYGQYTARHGYVVTVKASPGYYDLIKYLVPFVAIVGICFAVLFISLMIRLCRERRRQARKRLPRSHLKKIPTKKYKKGDPEETCAICLEDFQESDKLRLLPCRHAYHCKCIDPWLTKNRKVCPVCKRRVGPRNSDSSDSDETDAERTTTSSTGRNAAGAATAPTSSSSGPLLTSSRDNAPLLSNAQPMATTSSADCPPYLRNVLIASRATIAGTGASTFLRATNNFVHLGNIFHRRAASPPSAFGGVGPPSISPSAGGMSSAVPSPQNNDDDPLDGTMAQQQHHHGDETLQQNTNHQLISSSLEDHTNVGVVQQQQQPVTTTINSISNSSNASASPSSSSSSPLQFVRSRVVGMRDRLTHLISRAAQRSDGPAPPHTLLENDDEDDTTSTMAPDSCSRGATEDTLSHQTCDTLDDAGGDGGGGSSSVDGHSMTTVHSASNRHFAPVPSSSAVVDLSSCTPVEPQQQQQHMADDDDDDADYDHHQQQHHHAQ